MYIDFKILDSNTRLDSFPLPRIADLLGKLDEARYFIKIDKPLLKMRIAAGNTHKMAFHYNKGLYVYFFMPFRYCDPPNTF